LRLPKPILDRPSSSAARTSAYGYPTWQDNSAAHSGIPSKEELEGAKKNLGYPTEPLFYVSEEVLAHYREAVPAGEKLEADWNAKFAAYEQAFPELAAELKRILAGELPAGWEEKLPVFKPDTKGIPTRSASNKVINALSGVIPEMMGGSADLTTSNSTLIENTKGFQADQYDGRYIYFGVREHAIGYHHNGLAVHKGRDVHLPPPSWSSLTTCAQLCGLSALSNFPATGCSRTTPSTSVRTAPTHQPVVEHLTSSATDPNVVTMPRQTPTRLVKPGEQLSNAATRHCDCAFPPTVTGFDREKYNPAEARKKALTHPGPGRRQTAPHLIGLRFRKFELIVRLASTCV
jgi:transketolase